MTSTEDILRMVVALERSAEAQMLYARVLKAQLVAVLAGANAADTGGVAPAKDAEPNTAQPPAPAADAQPLAPPCKCPANRRKVASVMGHPTRTRCTLCEKEHD